MINTLDDIVAARELIATPEAWTQGTFARLPNGDPVEVGDKRAVCFCAAGAIYRASGFDPTGFSRLAASRVDRAYDELCKETPEGVISLNDADNTTHADVLAAFDKTISRLRVHEPVAN